MGTIIMLVVMIGLLWFMQRSQRKQAQERQDQLNALNKGDEIVTIGGLYGIIDEVDTDNKKMVLDVDGIYLTIELSALKRVVNKAAQDTIETTVIEEVETPVEEDQAIEADSDSDTAVKSED